MGAIMKLFYRAAVAVFPAIWFLASGLPVRAQDRDNPPEAPPQEEGADSEELSPAELEEKFRKDQAAEKEQVGKMMKVFTALEGSWSGQESLKYEEDVLPPKEWKDQWEGNFVMGGRYFEMTGQTSGEDMNSAYKWVCTFDPTVGKYRAWYFGDTGQNEYTGKLSQDGTHVIWSAKSPISGSESRFTMKAEGNRLKCHGTDTLADGRLLSTQTSEYTRKRVEL